MLYIIILHSVIVLVNTKKKENLLNKIIWFKNQTTNYNIYHGSYSF